MEQISKYLIIIASLMTVKLTVTGSKNETKPKIDRRHYQMPIFINICDIVDRRSKVHCYCDSNKPKMATRADCWIFGGGITEDDPIWPSFSSQSEIEHLMFNVRTDDALKFIPAKAIVRLDRLKHLSIQFGTIKTIYPYAFTNSSTVRQILLKSNKVSNLEKHSFSQMMMLSNLSLDDNQISEIKTDVFFNLPNLHVLHLSNNNLSLLHEGCFKHLNNLIELKLDYNYISVVTREMLEGLENLSRLNLRNNKINMIGNLAFSELWGLKELMLDNNAIEFISERAFGGLTQLRKLTLSGNKLATFYEYVLEDIRSLVVLDLRDNLLTTISYETIRPVVENDKSLSSVVYLDGGYGGWLKDHTTWSFSQPPSYLLRRPAEHCRLAHSLAFISYIGNPLNCNCRLSWIYILRNETQDKSMKHALEKISCIPEPTSDRRTDVKDEEMDSTNVLTSDNYEYYDKGDDYNDRDKEKNASKSIKLVDYPLETLPCPKELMQSIEETYGHPVQNEIRLKAFSKVTRIIPSISLIVVILMLV